VLAFKVTGYGMATGTSCPYWLWEDPMRSGGKATRA